MQLTLQKKHRVIAMVIAALVGLTGAILAWQFKDKTEEVEQLYQILNYTLTPDINIDIKVIENDFYEQEVLPDDRVVVTSLLDSLLIYSDFKLVVPDADHVKLSLKQVEILETYYGESQNIIWQRETTPIIKEQQAQNELTISTKKEFYAERFQAFLAKISEELELTPDAQLSLVWHLEGEAQKGDTILPITTEYRLPISLFSSMFVIDKSTLTPLSGSQEVTETAVKAVNPQLYPLGIALGVIGLIALLLLFFVVKDKQVSDYQRIVRYGQRNFDDRLVQINKPLQAEQTPVSEITSLDDLIKIADEIRQPVMYYDNQKAQSIAYFVSTEHIIYQYEISAEANPEIKHIEQTAALSDAEGGNCEEVN